MTAVEVVIMIGLPASGKSTFYRQRYASTHALVSKDLFPNARNRAARQERLIEEALVAGRPVVVDNTNPTVEDRAAIIAAARRHGARVVGHYFATPLVDALARNAGRVGKARVPDRGVLAIAKRLCRPSLDEGYDELSCVRLVDGAFTVEPWRPETTDATG